LIEIAGVNEFSFSAADFPHFLFRLGSGESSGEPVEHRFSDVPESCGLASAFSSERASALYSFEINVAQSFSIVRFRLCPQG